MTQVLAADIPRSLDRLVAEYARAGTSLEAWLFEDELSRRDAEAKLAAAGVRARIRSAYKPLLHFFLEEVELSGLTATTVYVPSHPLAVKSRFRLEAYPLAGLLKGVQVRFEQGGEDLHYVVVTEHGARRVEHRVFAPNRDRLNILGKRALAPCGWIKTAEDAPGEPLQTEYELAFDRIMAAVAGFTWPKAEPFFDVLDIAVETTGIEHRLSYGDECVSTREALHEDLYFSILEYFKAANGLDAEDRRLQVGQIVPDIRAGTGPTKIRVTLRPGDRSTWTDAPQPLETAMRPLAPAQIAQEVEALGGARFDVVSGQGRPVLATHIPGRGPGLLVSGGQHANETSGVVGGAAGGSGIEGQGNRLCAHPAGESGRVCPARLAPPAQPSAHASRRQVHGPR